MECEKHRGWAIQGFKIVLMRKSKGQRTSGWSGLKFKNMLMSPSKGQAGGRCANEGNPHSIPFVHPLLYYFSADTTVQRGMIFIITQPPIY